MRATQGLVIRKALVIQTAFIGDVLLATAVAEKLYTEYPDAAIDLLLRKGNERLFRGHPFIASLLVWDKSQRWKSAFGLLRQIRRKRYDLVVNLQRFATTGVLTAFSGAHETVGFDRNPLSMFFTRRVKHRFNGSHETSRNQQLIAAYTDETPAPPAIYPGPEDEEKVRPLQSTPYLTLSPGSVWMTKRWPVDKWINMVNGTDRTINIFLLGSPDERALCESIRTKCVHPGVRNLAGELDLLPSASLMKKALMNFVNDSAPLHLASAVNAPVTAVYCSTVPAFGFGPLSDKQFIIETREPLSCRPCGRHGFQKCPEGHFRCALTIEMEQISGPMAAAGISFDQNRASSSQRR